MASGNHAPSQASGPVKTIEVPVPNPLSLDPKPALSADLDAKGHDLLAVGNVECRTINGKNLWREMIEAHSDAIEKSTAASAPKEHSHSEFQQLATEIAQKAHKDHTHPLQPHTHPLKEITGTLPLDRLEDGEKVKDLLTRDLCPLQHSHPGMEAAIKVLDKAVVALQASDAGKLDESALPGLQKSITALGDALRSELKAVEVKIPVIPSQVKQAIGIKRMHVPFKGTVVEMVGRDEEGTPVKVAVTRSGKEIKIGDAVAADDVLSLSPANASVRIRFQ